MTEFIKALDELKAKVAEMQIYAEEAKETTKKIKDMVDNLHVIYLAEQE